uniref:Uncharacterized protein n=1 Tax=Rhizophora mucronata TaxID=61149 RepID=A0A2P2KA00_RHIMU
MEPTLRQPDQPSDPRIPLSVKVVLVPFPWTFNGMSSMTFIVDPKPHKNLLKASDYHT